MCLPANGRGKERKWRLVSVSHVSHTLSVSQDQCEVGVPCVRWMDFTRAAIP
jgi:hypothetical protein